MKLEVEQKRLDEEKWLKSEQEGRDVCGEFGYCQFCNKTHAYPCAKALSDSKKTTKKVAEKPAKKACAKKTCVKATAKAVETKKTAAKKPAAKTAKTKK